MSYIKLSNIVKFKKKYRIFFVGVGGVSMYQLAIYLKEMGHDVLGSDIQQNEYTTKLENKDIKVFYEHNKKNVEGVDVVFFSYAVENGVEVKWAKDLNIPCFSRAELLGEILKTYKTSICVAGAHGKTTTTALIYSILKEAKKNVDLHLGGNLIDEEAMLRANEYKKEFIVCEACEYKDAFLNLKPTIAVINNVAPEHLDYFKNFNNVLNSFNKFSKSANMLICNNLHVFENKNTIKFGENGNFYAKNIKMYSNGTYFFDCYKNGQFYDSFKINLIGRHNVDNALASIAVCDKLNIDKKHIKNALANFKGVERRFEILNKEKFIVHDYAHHPDEIKAVINETLKFYKGKLLVVFQPHTYSRTKKLMNEFVNFFKTVNNVVIYKTYSAREKYVKQGSAKTLAKNIGECTYFSSKQKLSTYVLNKINQGYGVLMLGAGNINHLSKNIAKLC